MVAVPPGKQRALLAALLLDAGRVVSLDQLAEALWGPEPPPSARVTVQNYVMRLRKALGDAGRARISTQPGGYVIRVEDGELDTSRFEVLLRAARAAARDGSWDQAARDAHSALALWRGEPLADAGSEVLTLRELPRLEELRLQALETRLEADLNLGRHADVIADLRHLAGLHPLRERLHALLMLALYRDSQQAEALAAYSRARDVLIDELGTEPGTELRELHQRMLTADPALQAMEPTPSAPGRPGPVVPRQLPASVAHFTGRAAELSALASLLDRDHATTPTVVISAIAGTAGVGKTALAVQWAHQVADRFPDGQLYVNLRGYDPSQPVPAADALAGFLRALGVAGPSIPAGTDERAALYRSLLAGRRILVLLDNARDADQVRPLLLADPAALVLVTSRNELAGLITADGALPLTLDVLAEAEAHELIAARIGPARLAAEPQAARELITRCARLPLALAITAARAAARPSFRLAALAAELADASGRLDALSTGDNATDVRTVFSWSYKQLSPAEAHLFRLLGLHPGPDITAPAVASLAGLAQPEAHRLLRDLTRGHLLSEPAPGRYALHDLLRAYASEQATATDSLADRHEATGRMLDHYLHTAHSARRLLQTAARPIRLTAPQPGVTPEPLDSFQEALDWFDAECHVLFGAAALAAEAGFDIHAWQLPWTMVDYLAWRGHAYDELHLRQRALQAAMRVGDKAGQAAALVSLGGTHLDLGDYDQALAHQIKGLELYRQIGDRSGEAHAHMGLSETEECRGHHVDALHHAEQALDLYRTAGDRAGEANVLNDVGWRHAMLGDYEVARAFCQQALPLQRELGNRAGEAFTWDSLGYAEHHLGRFTEAAACYGRSLTLIRELGHRRIEALVLSHLGDNHCAVGKPQEAQEAWQQALAIYDELHHPDDDQVRDRLSAANSSAVPLN